MRLRQCREEPLGPAIDIVCQQVGEHPRMPLLALVKRHFERRSNRLRHSLDFVRVDDQGAVELRRGAGKAGKHEDAGIFGILSGDILLGDKVHAVAQRCHQADMRRSEKPRQRGARIGAVDIADRRPRRLAVPPVDLTDDRTHRAIDGGIFRHLGSAFRGDLKEGHLAQPLRLGVEKVAEGLDAIGDALRVIETIDPENETAVPETVAHPCHQPRVHCNPGGPRIIRSIDGDRKSANMHIAAAELEGFAGRSGDAVPCLEIAAQIVGVGLGLQPDEIVVGKRADRFCVLRQDHQDVRRRARDMEEEADRIIVPQRAQLLGERQQVIVVDPDHVVGLR